MSHATAPANLNRYFDRVLPALMFSIMAGMLTFGLIVAATPAHAASSHTTAYETHAARHGRCVVKLPADGVTRARVGCHDGYRVTLAPCPEEDSRTCYWNAGTMGNRAGHSFIDLRGRAFYLHRI